MVVLAAACGDDDGPTATIDSVAGTYTLRTVNGASVPAVAETTPVRLEILSGSVTLNADRSFTNLLQIRTTDAGTVSTREVRLAGTYTLSGATLTLTDPAQGQIRAPVADGAITVSDGDVTFVYRR